LHPLHPVGGAHGSLFTPVPGEVVDTHRYYFRFRAFNTEVGLGNWRLTVAHHWHFLGDGDERWTSVDHGYYNLNSLYNPPSTAPCQSVLSSSFTTSDCRLAHLVTASTPAACLHRFAMFSSMTSGGSLTSCPYYILLDPRPIASPKSAALSPLCSLPCHIQDVPSLS